MRVAILYRSVAICCNSCRNFFLDFLQKNRDELLLQLLESSHFWRKKNVNWNGHLNKQQLKKLNNCICRNSCCNYFLHFDKNRDDFYWCTRILVAIVAIISSFCICPPSGICPKSTIPNKVPKFKWFALFRVSLPLHWGIWHKRG